jgi:hypothetical protein
VTGLDKLREMADMADTLDRIRKKLEEAKVDADQGDLRAFLTSIEEVFKIAGVQF